MSDYNHQIKNYFMRLLLLPLVTIVAITTVASNCPRKTVFPDQPATHRLIEELNEWPEYYRDVKTGVSSRILGLQLGSNIDENITKIAELLSEVKGQWENIENINSSVDLIEYFNQHNLEPISEAILVTLRANEARRPPDDLDDSRTARAIKVGLADAYYKINEELN